MKLKARCNFCGIEFERLECQFKNKKYHFCSRKHLADFSNKAKNPNGYGSLKSYDNISSHITKLNLELNPKSLISEVRAKMREYHVNDGKGR